MFFQSEVEVSVGRARQRKTWGFNGKHGLLRSENQVCEPESSYASYVSFASFNFLFCPKTSRVGRGLVCLLALSVGRAIMWKAQFRKPDSKGATVMFGLFCLQKLHYALFGCLFQRWEHRQTLGKAFDRLHRWVLSMNSISSVCKHEMSCSLTCERFFWRPLPPGFFLSFCSLFLQVGVVAKRQQERLNSGRLAWLWAGDVTLWRTSRHFGENHRPFCGQYVQCEYSEHFWTFWQFSTRLAVWVSEIRSRQEMATAAEACKYRHASKQSSQGPAAQIISLHFCISPFPFIFHPNLNLPTSIPAYRHSSDELDDVDLRSRYWRWSSKVWRVVNLEKLNRMTSTNPKIFKCFCVHVHNLCVSCI